MNKNNGVSSGVSSMLQSQALLMFMNNTKTKSSSNQTNSFLFIMLFSTILATSIPILLGQIGNFITFNLNSIRYKFQNYFRNPKLVQIKLTYNVHITKYGTCKTLITTDAIGVLNYVRINIYKLPGLYSLLQEHGIHKYYDETTEYLPIYKINQSDKILLWKKGQKKIYLSTVSNDDINIDDKLKTKKTSLILTSTTMGLEELNDFVKLCSREYANSKIDDDTRYIFTHCGFNETGGPVYRKEIFKPYSDFDNLFSEGANTVKKRFDFFVSKKGIEWYKRRNIPYHLSIMLHGEPGTGKSAIAAAVAKRYNLHIVRIKLSTIKTNKEFISAFKCKKFSDSLPEFKYKDLLYLFDEIDTETNDVLLDRKYKVKTKITTTTSSIEKKISSVALSSNDELCLGTILEEFSGINQMWGRKMILISNYPERIDKAVIRPGRINIILKLGKSTRYDTICILNNFFDSPVPNYVYKYIPDNKFTPAEIICICSASKNILEFIQKTKDDTENDTDDTGSDSDNLMII